MALSLLAGCTVGPDFQPPPPPAVQGYTHENLAVLSNPGSGEPPQRVVEGQPLPPDWWTSFRCDELDALVRAAIAKNPNLAAARATLAKFREAAAQARGGQYPQADFAANASRLKTSLLPEGVNQLGPTANDFAIGPTVSYALDLFGGQRRQIERQDALAEYQAYQFDGAYLVLTGSVVRAAIEAAKTRAEIDTVEALVRDDDQTVEMVDRLFALHYRTRVDLESARSQRAADRALLPPLRQRLAVMEDALAILTGEAPGDAVVPNLRIETLTVPQTLPVTVPSELVHRRPDVRAAEAQLHAASAAIGIATAQFYPSLTLSASITQESLSTASLFSQGAMGWLVGAGLSAPVFHGGQLEAQRRGAVDAYEEAYASYRQTVLASFAQVADTLQALDHDAQLLQAEREAIDAAGAALDAARARYAVARIDILQVLDAERALGRARLAFIQAQAARLLDTVQLFGAIGGGSLE